MWLDVVAFKKIGAPVTNVELVAFAVVFPEAMAGAVVGTAVLLDTAKQNDNTALVNLRLKLQCIHFYLMTIRVHRR